MVDAALSYLQRDRAHYIDMIEPIRRAQAKVLYADTDGVLLLDLASQLYLLAADSQPRYRAFLDTLPPTAELLVVHDEAGVRAAEEASGRCTHTRCRQCLYEGEPLALPEIGIAVRTLGVEYAPVLRAHYHLVEDPDYLAERCAAGVMHGAFSPDGALMGFIGMHTEGSLGILEVLPTYRRRGVAYLLQSYMINFCLARGMVPFGQVFDDNAPSLALQKKLGCTISDKPIFWITSGNGVAE